MERKLWFILCHNIILWYYIIFSHHYKFIFITNIFLRNYNLICDIMSFSFFAGFFPVNFQLNSPNFMIHPCTITMSYSKNYYLLLKHWLLLVKCFLRITSVLVLELWHYDYDLFSKYCNIFLKISDFIFPQQWS